MANIYIGMLADFKDWIYTETDAKNLRGHWKNIFPAPTRPLDLEIGCGNGFFFENIVKNNLQRNFLGIEIKYKPLVQTIRRVKKLDLPNGRGIRFRAEKIDEIFASGEINNVYLYFPDPWPKKRHAKNRLVKVGFLEKLYAIQTRGSFLDFKTDSESYFDEATEEFAKSQYKQVRYSRDLHQSEWRADNFITAFENIFLKKGQPIFYSRYVKE